MFAFSPFEPSNEKPRRSRHHDLLSTALLLYSLGRAPPGPGSRHHNLLSTFNFLFPIPEAKLKSAAHPPQQSTVTCSPAQEGISPFVYLVYFVVPTLLQSKQR
jgi:hypothetical protein